MNDSFSIYFHVFFWMFAYSESERESTSAVRYERFTHTNAHDAYPFWRWLKRLTQNRIFQFKFYSKEIWNQGEHVWHSLNTSLNKSLETMATTTKTTAAKWSDNLDFLLFTWSQWWSIIICEHLMNLSNNRQKNHTPQKKTQWTIKRNKDYTRRKKTQLIQTNAFVRIVTPASM